MKDFEIGTLGDSSKKWLVTVCLSVCLSVVCVCVCLSVSVICMSVCVCLSVCVSVCLSVCLSVRLSVCLYVGVWCSFSYLYVILCQHIDRECVGRSPRLLSCIIECAPGTLSVIGLTSRCKCWVLQATVQCPIISCHYPILTTCCLWPTSGLEWVLTSGMGEILRQDGVVTQLLSVCAASCGLCGCKNGPAPLVRFLAGCRTRRQNQA